MNKLQQQLATGKKITEASDDPIIAAKSLKLRTDVAEIAQFQRNTSDAVSWMETSETAMSNYTDVLQRVRELSVQSANGILTPGDSQKVGQEIKQLKSQLIHIGNTSYAGRYIFSGFETSKKLIIDDESDPNYGAFNINVTSELEKIDYEIGVGDSIDINVCGGKFFNSSTKYPNRAVAIGNNQITFPIEITAGVNDTMSLSVDGLETVDITIPPNKYDDMASLKTVLATEINNTSAIVPDIVVENIGNRLQFVSGTTGSTSNITINDTALVSTANTTLGINSYASYISDENTIGSNNGITRGDDIIYFPLTITPGVDDTLTLNIDGVEDVTITIPANIYSDIDSLAMALQTEINNSSATASDINVTALGDRLQFKSGTNGPLSKITIDKDPLISTSAVALGVTTTTDTYGTTANKGKLIVDMELLEDAFNRGDGEAISQLLGNIDEAIQSITKIRADLGARYNRVELTDNRLSGDSVTFTKLMSQNEDVDMAEVIMNLKNEENVYKASLEGGARIIQPTLLDFLR
jgi:flagellar hook-associated protein 3 FlgL